MSYVSLCDCAIDGMQQAIDICDMDDLKVSWVKEVVLHKWTNAALWVGLKN